jgi:hypothetical protein
MSNEKNAWLLLTVSLPGKSTAPRIRLWRRLKSLGTAVLRDGVYLLPNRDVLQETMEEQVKWVQTLGGTATLLQVEPVTETDEHFRALFDRGEEYAALMDALTQWRASLANATAAQARRLLQQLRRDLEALVAIDYFPGPAQAHGAQTLAEMEGAFTRQFAPDEPHSVHTSIRPLQKAEYCGKLWATRQHLWVDRVASAWLIRRFIDPEARFLWLQTPQDCPADALGFDFDRATFTHVGNRVTFEVLLASFDLDCDPALARLGVLVHSLDTGGVPVPEAAGFEAILTGVRAHCADDDQLLTAMTPVLNALYTTFGPDTP